MDTKCIDTYHAARAKASTVLLHRKWGKSDSFAGILVTGLVEVDGDVLRTWNAYKKRTQ